ncbi:disease resistance protein RGA3 isoform X6 [Populus alba x Populus x berolinensis]|nr:disease resistance protein RGA3 isoform X6 [Populus alba x Populus x berolinensis]
MAEALLSPILEQLSAVVAQQVQEEVNLVVGVKKQVDKLKSNLLSIQSVLEDADRKQVKDKAVRDWVDKLKDVCYDMDDVLDEWSTAILRWKMEEAEENTRSLQKMRCSFLKSPCFCLNQVVRRRDIALKIKEVCEKVDDIAKARDMYGFALYRATDIRVTDELQRLTTTSFVDESSVIGRDGEKRNVVSKLLAESSQEAQDVDVITVVGLGGIGKTTLAQLAFNDSEVTTHFEKKIWVCVSEPFDEVRIAKAILEQLEGRPTNLVELQSLLQGVSESITGKRLLLVLDDVWTENHGQWEKLKPSLTGCARGSRILVTTRKDAVATMMGTGHRINIKELSDEICRSIFNHVAFQERSKDERERLTDIGDKIANKCKGLPLAAKVLGGLMQSKRTREEWERVLSSELWRLDEVDRDQVERRIFVPLLLSYYDLPFVVRRCFLYCAMFPKDYEMGKDELVKMWMAQGYLKENSGGDMELVGEQYFQVLATRSFFQDFKADWSEGMKFKMHDIVHDFAQYMTKNECLTVDNSKLGEATMETSIERVRHLSMMLSEESSFPKSIHKAKGLRSLLINTTDPSLGAVLPDVFKQLTRIRSLNLSWSSIKEIPNEVGKLIHLRHLNLARCRELESLPETICDLCNLQSLDVTWCISLEELPKAIGKLIKLRHLRIFGSGVAFIPKGIERITCLQTLDVFAVCGGGENESKAANLRELKNLNHIGGRLEIQNLGGVKESSDAAEAQLKNKKRLLRLELDFFIDLQNGILIEALRPPSDLEDLTIDGYEGLELPNWMMTLTRLQVLTLRHCSNLEFLPPLGRLPNLESLEVSSWKVRRLDAGFLGIEKDENASINEGEIARVTAFPKLKRLSMKGLGQVEEWEGIERRVGEEDANTTSIISIMPQLRELMIDTCPLLRALPDFVLAAPLQKLIVSGCRNLRKRYGKEEMGGDWQKISHIPKIYFRDI